MSERYYTEHVGASWCVRDHELLEPIGPHKGQPRIVQWFSFERHACEERDRRNATGKHAIDEPTCCICGMQPAGPLGEEHPRCASCWSSSERY